ncbi:hypothetical protein GCM10009651_20530 [Microbacterium natoriense]|uniref:hypothetical protein n=1 Tax=Microbacterium natoriense TaxID=284570 RepID=UPI0031CE2A17
MTSDQIPFQLKFIDPGAVLDGVPTPEIAPWLPEMMAFVESLFPRFKSLVWAAEKRPEVFGGALLTFSRKRFAAAADAPHLLPDRAWGTIATVPAVDRLRTALGGSWDPRTLPVSWPNQLFLAVDDLLDACWLLRAGLTVPAALVARGLFERWSLNVAHHFDLTRDEDESDEAFFTRVWLRHGAPGVPSDAGAWWAWLSELLHARPGQQAFGGDAAASLQTTAAANAPHHDAIAQVIELLMRHLRGGVAILAEKAGHHDGLPSLVAPPPTVLVREKLPLSEAVMPLDYFETYRHRSEEWVSGAVLYRSAVLRDEWELTSRVSLTMTAEAFLERRGRAVERARGAFADEKGQLGDSFDPEGLAARVFRQSTIAEMAMQLAEVVDGVERDALIVAAQSAEGASRLWLEDSDHAVGCLRVLLEQVARLRAHRLKPHRAARLEDRGSPSASRWVSEAGWKRLAVLMRAFNEYAHYGWRSHRNGAGRLLHAVRRNPDGFDTRRGSAVDAGFLLLASELRDRLEAVAPAVAHEFGERVTLVDRESHLRVVESYLNRVFLLREHDFGDPDFTRLCRDSEPNP